MISFAWTHPYLVFVRSPSVTTGGRHLCLRFDALFHPVLRALPDAAPSTPGTRDVHCSRNLIVQLTPTTRLCRRHFNWFSLFSFWGCPFTQPHHYRQPSPPYTPPYMPSSHSLPPQPSSGRKDTRSKSSSPKEPIFLLH